MKKVLVAVLAFVMASSVSLVWGNEVENEDNQVPTTPFQYTVKGELPIIPEEWEGLENGEVPDGDEGIAPAFITDNIADEQESNNSAISARQISLTMGRTGTIGSESDVDFYKFRCPASGKYRFDLIDVPASKELDYDIYLYTGNPAVEVGSSTRPYQYDSIIAELEEGTLYYLKVVAFYNKYSKSDYYTVTVTDEECAVLGYEYPFKGIDVPKNISANYGYYSNGDEHYGLDLSIGNGTSTEGTPLYAPGSGEVVKVGFDSVDTGYGAGYYITMDMDDEYTLPGDEDAYVTYMHMQSLSTQKKGNRVSASTRVGYVGNTGNSFGAHLHVGIFNIPKWISGNLSESNNPLRYYTQYNFTGEPEDRTEYDRNWRIQQEENLTYPRDLYVIPAEIIRYIGEDDFDSWARSTTSYEKSLMSCLDHFSISHETFLAILAENPLLEEDYPEELKQQIFDYRSVLK